MGLCVSALICIIPKKLHWFKKINLDNQSKLRKLLLLAFKSDQNFDAAGLYHYSHNLKSSLPQSSKRQEILVLSTGWALNQDWL